MSRRAAAPTFGPNDLAELSFPNSGAGVSFRLLQDLVVPRPVFLLSTVSRGQIEHLKVDYRDVILAGEYRWSGDSEIRVRNLNKPIEDEA
jgi:hypothetical protein